MKEFLTVNYCYPPTVHIFNGALKAILGNARWVDSLCLVFFSTILSFSTCATALLLLKNRAAAALTVCFINIYPCVALLSHIKLLDFPHLSLFTLAMFTLLNWQRQPTWSRAILCGIALGAACTTKQIASFFLFAPCLLALLQQLYARRYDRALQLTAAGAIVVAFLAVWVVPNWHEISGYMHRNSGHLGSRTVSTAFFPNLLGYANCAPGLTGYPLLALCLLCLTQARVRQLRSLALPASASLAGIICMSALPFQLPEHRYIAPVLLFPALLCAGQICRFYLEKKQILFAVASFLAVYGAVQFAVLNFSPYPLELPRPLRHALLNTNSDRRGPLEPGFNPTAAGDLWGQQWVVRQCKTAAANQVCWLNMLPSTPELSVHTLCLVSRYEGSNVQPTTSRLWTPLGDKIEFDASSCKNFHFYLLKTGKQGLQFESNASAQNYARIERFVAQGPDYQLLSSKTIQDGSQLSLYIRKDFASAGGAPK